MLDTIPNCAIFGASAKINLFKHIYEDETFYNSSITFFLNANDDEERAITLITEIYDNCPLCAARHTFSSLSEIFDVCDNVLILDSIGGNVIGEFDLFDDNAVKWAECKE